MQTQGMISETGKKGVLINSSGTVERTIYGGDPFETIYMKVQRKVDFLIPDCNSKYFAVVLILLVSYGVKERKV